MRSISTSALFSSLLCGVVLITPLSAGAQASRVTSEVDLDEFRSRLDTCMKSEEWLRTACLKALHDTERKERAPEAEHLSPPRDTHLDVAHEPVKKSSTKPYLGRPPSDEVHLIGIYEPNLQRGIDGQVRSGEVPVFVDRPGQGVTLVLTSYEPVRWAVSTGPDTVVERIILGGYGVKRSQAMLNTEDFAVEVIESLPYAYKGEGTEFQLFHGKAARAAGVKRASSFQGSYSAPEGGFSITDAPGVKTQADVLAELAEVSLPITDLSVDMRAAIKGGEVALGKWSFGETGFSGISEEGLRVTYEVPLDLPEVSWPVGAAYDPDGQRLWGVTFGGEGILYQYDIVDDSWSSWSMNHVDVGGLIYDASEDRLITTPGRTGWGFHIMNTKGQLLESVDIQPDDFPGLKESYDFGNGPDPILEPLLIEDGKILLRAKARHRPIPGETTKPHLLYLVDINEVSVNLVQ